MDQQTDTSGQSNTSPAAQQQSVTQQTDQTTTNVSALEAEVAKELGNGSPSPQPVNTLADKAKKLADARRALEEKITTLENDVKGKLATLKELKASIEEEIAKIKELKETEGKIDIELHKIDELEKKRAEIEHEIQAIEQTTTGI